MFKKILYNTEPLEVDLKSQINSLSKDKKKTIYLIFLKKILKYLYFKFQRLFLKPNLRHMLAKIERFIYRNSNHTEIKNEYADELKKNSTVSIENLFNSSEQKQIIDHLSKEQKLTSIYTNHDDFSLSKPPHNVSTGYIKTENVLNCPNIILGANNEKLISIINSYFNCKFKLDWIWAWWSFPSKTKIGPQSFHRDYESFNFVKVFVYLTDVDKENGPHFIIKGSDRFQKFYERKRFSDDQINFAFDKDSIKEIVGNKGTTFLANTYAIHKGLLPVNQKRLVLVYLFSVIPSLRSPKIPPLNLNQLDEKSQKIVKKNKYINSQFINFK